MAGEIRVRAATPDDEPAVLNVLDAAMLDTGNAGAALARGDALVAIEDGRVLGALVLIGDRIEALAVRRSRRGQGIGTRLVEAAADHRGRLVAEFDGSNRPFYRSLGFRIERIGPDRFRGVRR